MTDKPMTAERLQQIRDRFDSGMYNKYDEDDILSLLNEYDRLIKESKRWQPTYSEMVERVENAYIAHLQDFDDPYDDCTIAQDIKEHDARVIKKCAELVHPEDFAEGSSEWCALAATRDIILNQIK